ncbi:MAG: tRNA 2-thiouridine(34) synthase MnmA [Planctomycetia bacterium]|nr:tRNA 2-thiouridine(34) synthase MnmA [Planctomycetia bacterium]
MPRVLLAMSGGVDSSVAAHLLLEAGHDVVGLFMRHGQAADEVCATSGEERGSYRALLPVVQPRPGHKQGCCSSSDAADARRVADRLGIPFYAINFEEEFGRIMDYFVAEYASGRTPNPCVVCNNWLKFGKLADYADTIGADYIATGHYARLTREPGESIAALRRGIDGGKDQSYVLFGIQRALLPRVLFPVGEYDKPTIRRLAGTLGLNVADKQDSQEICFINNGDYAEFVRKRHGDLDLSGELVTTDGAVVGRHTGIEQFTIGQRKGLGVAFGERRFVVRIEAETRRVVIGEREDLARSEVSANRTNWLIEPPSGSLECSVKIRYLSTPVRATVKVLPGDRLHASLHEPKDAIAPGQALVCYDGDRVLGGGWIE